MSIITYRVKSIDLKDSTLHTFSKNALIRLNLTQKPSSLCEEYVLKNAQCLADINHEFVIDDPFNKVDILSLTVRSVMKKTSLASVLGFEDNTKRNAKPTEISVDKFVSGFRENRNNNADCEYVEPKHSLIGYCQVNLREIEKGTNNVLHLNLITKKNETVGYVNLEIYSWDSPNRINNQQKMTQKYDTPILFVDPGCQPADPQHSAY